MTASERVARGYDWLMTNRAGTLTELDPNAIDVESAWFCPLGQTGDYFEALESVVPYDDGDNVDVDGLYKARFEWAKAHGFAAGEYGEYTTTDYDALNAAWRELLT